MARSLPNEAALQTDPANRIVSHLVDVPRRTMLTRSLVKVVMGEFTLNHRGVHGTGHWERVRKNGLFLASHEQANPRVIELFAYIHDIKREHDYRDPDHGERAADWARWANGRHFDLDPAELDLLVRACSLHSDGKVEEDVTVQCCWDADRLDLGRAGKTPHPKYLGTATARKPQVIDWAFARSLPRQR